MTTAMPAAQLPPAAMSTAQLNALSRAAMRERGNICPTVGVYASASDALVNALDERGFVDWDGPVPRISAIGRAAIRWPA